MSRESLTASLTGHRWSQRTPPPEQLAWARQQGLSPVAASVLAPRVPPSASPRWLRPDLDVVLSHSPFAMRHMDRTIDRLRKALRDRERIFVVTDYDVDGTTSSLILQHALHLAGGGAADLAWHIPDRFTEGYGFRPVAAEKAKELGCGLVITADIGVRDHDAITRARELGLDVLVCDHHLPAEASVPKHATAVLCPPQSGCAYPNPALAACGVSLKVAQALLEKHPKRERLLRSFLKLAAIGTVADVVDLATEENRAIVALGLQELSSGRHSPGLTALLEVAGVLGRPLRADDLGFRVGPRINAAGRLEQANAVVELLNERNPSRARDRARALDRVNTDRKALQQRLEAAVLKQVGSPPPPFVVVWGDEDLESDSPWHRGIAGIVASRVREQVHRPVAVITVTGDQARGSIRSTPGIHAVHALDSTAELLYRYGGHPAAAGFSLESRHLPAFAQRLQSWAAAQGAGNTLPEHVFDCDVSPRALSRDLFRELSELGPFGKGNPSPLLRLSDVSITNISPMSDGKHVRFQVGGHKAVWWRGGQWLSELRNAHSVDLLVELEENTWKGRTSLQLKVEDVRLG